MTHTRKPAERTLTEMLADMDIIQYVRQGLPRTLAEAIVRRAADVARTFHPGMFQPGEVRNAKDVYAAIAHAILADAGLTDD